MKHLFPEFYRRSDNEFSDLFKKAIFVVDANMLLHLYRYPPTARADLFKILKYLAAGDRLWVPFQAALEFQSNRLEVIAGQRNKYGEVRKVINEIQGDLKSKLDGLRLRKRHSAIDPDMFLSEISTACTKYLQVLSKHEEAQLDIYDDDKVRAEIDQLLDGRIGHPFEQGELTAIFEEGARRYKNKQPPGYKDEAEKKGTFTFHKNLVIKREYADLVVWKEIIRYIRDANPPGLIFVTDDNKEDWWAELSGKTIGPQPALISEIYHETGLTDFYIYNSERFMEFATASFNLEIEKESLEQVKQISRERIAGRGTSARSGMVRALLASIYGGACQICGQSDANVTSIIPTSLGGEMSVQNALLLCPNHQAQFDRGRFSVGADLRLLGAEGYLNASPLHRIEPGALEFHRVKTYRTASPDGIDNAT